MKKFIYIIGFFLYFVVILFFSSRNIFEYLKIKKQFLIRKEKIATLDKKIATLKLEIRLINKMDNDYIEILKKEKSRIIDSNEKLIIIKERNPNRSH